MALKERKQNPSSHSPPIPLITHYAMNDCFNGISRQCEGRPSTDSNAGELYEGLSPNNERPCVWEVWGGGGG